MLRASATAPPSVSARTPRPSLGALLRDRSGGILVYTALSLTLLLGLGTIGIDAGRMMLLKGQMQNLADTAALAAAVQLNGRSGARDRAEEVAREAFAAYSGLPEGERRLAISEVTFYSSLEEGIPATGDEDALAVEVTVEPRNLRLFFAPLLRRASGSAEGEDSALLDANAAAQPQPFICNAPPLMMCNPYEGDPTKSLTDANHLGRQVFLTNPPSSGNLAPGNFGLLALPDGSTSSKDIEEALAAQEPEGCYTLDLTTAPGARVNAVKDGINARFDGSDPAEVTRDYGVAEDVLPPPGSSVTVPAGSEWDACQAWMDVEGTESCPSSAPILDASDPGDNWDRVTPYQLYLWERGIAFDRTQRKTETTDPAYTQGEDRRLVKVPVVNCQAEGVKGKGTYPSSGAFLEVFLTRRVGDSGDLKHALIGEIVREVTPENDPNYHANVRLAR